MKIKLFATLFVGWIVALTPISAQAADIPQLNWERGMQQSVALGGDSNLLWKVTLKNDSGFSADFARSSKNGSGFVVYTIELPDDLKLGAYRVVTSAPGTSESLSSYINIIEATSYDPLLDPKTIGGLAVVAYTLLSFFSGSQLESKRSDEEEDPNSLGGVDTNYLAAGRVSKRTQDAIRIGRFKLVQSLDSFRSRLIIETSRNSKVFTRIFADGTWAQSLFGPFALLLPIAGAALGIAAGLDSDLTKSLIPTNIDLVLAIIVLGIFDAMAGFAAASAYFIYAMATSNVSTVLDLQTLLGFSLVLFTPILAAGATRPLRRSRDEWSLWERSTDLLVATFLTGWAVKSMVAGVNAFAHQQTELAKHSEYIALFSAGAIALRYVLEELAARLTPERISFISPKNLHSQTQNAAYIAIVIRVSLYLLFMLGFFGFAWQILVAIALLVIPEILKLNAASLPNSVKLYQLLPAGVPNIVVMALIGFFFSGWANSLPLDAASKTKTLVVILALPGFLIGIAKIFGRKPAPGDTRWYLRDHLTALYRIGGLVVFALAVLITIGVLP
jgi:hypothetical protein